MIVSKQEGEAAGKALMAGSEMILRGAFIRPHFVSIIKPIEKGWFKKDFVEQQDQLEKSNPTISQFLDAPHD